MSGRGARQRRSRARQHPGRTAQGHGRSRVPFRVGFTESDYPPTWWHDRKALPDTERSMPTVDLFGPLIDQIGPANARAQGWCV